MLKRILAILALFLSFSVFAATDVNSASLGDLETIKGIGPAIASRIVDERKNGPYKDWPDLVNRVKGIGSTSAGKLSSQGLTVNGAAYTGTNAPAADSKANLPPVAKTGSVAPAAAASTADKKTATLVKSTTIASSPDAATPGAPAASASTKASRKAAKKAAAASAASAAKQ